MNAATRKVTEAAKRAARTRRLQRMIATRVDQARHDAWEELIHACAKANPRGTIGSFERWFRKEWLRTIGGAP